MSEKDKKTVRETAAIPSKVNGSLPANLERLSPQAMAVVLQLDLVLCTMRGGMNQLAHACGVPGVAAALAQAVLHMQGVRDEFIRANTGGVVLAGPGDILPTPKV